MRVLVVPLVPKVAALYTVKGVVVPDPLPKVLLPAAALDMCGGDCLPPEDLCHAWHARLRTSRPPSW